MATSKQVPRFCYIDAMGGAPVEDDGSGPEIYIKGASSAALMSEFMVTLKDGTVFEGMPMTAKFAVDADGAHVTIIASNGFRTQRVDVTRHLDGTFELGASNSQFTKPVMYPMDAGAIRLQ